MCDFCNGKHYLDAMFHGDSTMRIDSDLDLKITYESGEDVDVYYTIHYCPMCGRKLNKEEQQ
ncbi:gp59 [Listeria phage P40]|uniref:gp59 n=1 Tax=Listeria phage P40 TaxID=560178 RepID=UPI0001819908|nr:gp59 [Listeria phage P40]ACI00419.1 gp59 [Listeria phage P40]